MTSIDAIFAKIHENQVKSTGYISSLQGVNTGFLALARILVNTYAASIGAIRAMLNAAIRIVHHLYSPVTTRVIESILPPLEAGMGAVEEAFVSSLKSLRVTFLWKIAPPLSAPVRDLVKVREEARIPGISSYERATVYSRIPLVFPPLSIETMEVLSDHASRISEASQSAFGSVPLATIGSVSRLPSETHRIFDTVRKPVADVYEAAAQKAETAPQVEGIPAWAITSATSALPAAEAAPAISSSALAVSEAMRIPQPITAKVHEAYSTQVLEPVSRAREVSQAVSIPPSTPGKALEEAEAPVDMGMVTGYPPLPEPSTGSWATEALSEVMRVLHITAREMGEFYHVNIPITRAPQLMVVSRVVEDHVRSVSDAMGEGMAAYRLSGLAALPPAMEMPLVHARERAEFYRMSASSMWAPQFLEASRVVGEQGRAVSETIAGGMEAYSRRVSPLTPPIVEAMATSMIAAPSVQEAVLPFFSAVSRVVAQYLKPVAGAPLMQEYLAMGAGLRIAFEEEKGLGPEGVEVKEPAAVPPGVVTLPYLAETMKAVSSYGYAGAGVGMKQALTALSTISREAAAPTIEARKVMVAEEVARIEVERALRSVEGGVIEDLVHLPAEGYALERIPVGPISFPTMKLQELAPFIQYIQTQAKTSTAPMQSTFNFNINVESLRDESDLRELEWKITRILKEQARRYGLL